MFIFLWRVSKMTVTQWFYITATEEQCRITNPVTVDYDCYIVS